ncbi:hypothetical protein EYF80_038012 [Liparis tanakae]|uniref:Uncharacterized protein n=1 Tax=Liparis tanakae TaxID=230148 RepID=A0A4Z2GGB6_9TELE|nr:hypothetical protein EYF80_038012 [Liparis tanakae]
MHNRKKTAYYSVKGILSRDLDKASHIIVPAEPDCNPEPAGWLRPAALLPVALPTLDAIQPTADLTGRARMSSIDLKLIISEKFSSSEKSSRVMEAIGTVVLVLVLEPLWQKWKSSKCMSSAHQREEEKKKERVGEGEKRRARTEMEETMVTRQGWWRDDAQGGDLREVRAGTRNGRTTVEREGRLPAVDAPRLFWLGVSAGPSQTRRICASASLHCRTHRAAVTVIPGPKREKQNQGGEDGRRDGERFGRYPFLLPFAHSQPRLSSHSPLFSNQ